MKKYVTLPLTNSLLKTKQTLYNLPSVSRPPLAENNHYHVLPLNSRSKTIQSQPPSNKIPSTQLFPHVSPAAYLMTEQLSIPQHSETVQHLSTVLNQDAVSQLNVTTQDASSATLTAGLTLSGQTEMESSPSAFLMEPSVMTPALPSELGSAKECWKPSVKFRHTMMFRSKCTNADIKLRHFYCLSWVSLPLTKTCHIISVPLSVFKEQPPVKLTWEDAIHAINATKTPYTVAWGLFPYILSYWSDAIFKCSSPDYICTKPKCNLSSSSLSIWEDWTSVQEPFWSNCSLCCPGAIQHFLHSSFSPITWPSCDTGSCLCKWMYPSNQKYISL